MSIAPALITGGSSILGGMLSGKGAKQAANDAANQQGQWDEKLLQESQAYDQQQRQGMRDELTKLIGAGNPFFQVPGQMAPAFLAAGQDTGQFGGQQFGGGFASPLVNPQSFQNKQQVPPNEIAQAQRNKQQAQPVHTVDVPTQQPNEPRKAPPPEWGRGERGPRPL